MNMYILYMIQKNNIEVLIGASAAGSGETLLLAVRIVFLNRVQNLQIHVMRANQYICIFGQFPEFRIQNMHSTLYVYFQSIFRNMHQNMR